MDLKKPSKDFLNEIERFTEENILNYPSSSTKEGGKVIHDALWGTQHLQAHEIELLDTPLLQRLRQIRQTAFTYLVFPSATHSRFEHTLGVVYQAQKILSALNEKGYSKLVDGYGDLVRATALLHDCGHGPLSHSSEEIYASLPDMKRLIGPGGKHEDNNPHEVLGYYIVKSESFKKYFGNLKDKWGLNIDLNLVAKIIIGDWDDPDLKYISDIINGPLDADKLDYLFRDGHFSGLPLKIDLDRLWYSLQIHYVPILKKKVRMLVLSINGVASLEQIVFSKMVLFTTLYQHHKVRTCDCMLKSIFIYCTDNDEQICNRTLKKATDFLWITDDKLFNEAQNRSKDDPLHKLIHNIVYRRLWKRALIISGPHVEKTSKSFFGYSRLKTLTLRLQKEDPALRQLAKEIWEVAKKPCELHDLWIDFPKPPPIGMADDTYVNLGTFKSPDFAKLSTIFKVDDWAEAFMQNSYRGHVFCPDDPKLREKISKAAVKVIEDKFEIKFLPSAINLCNIN